MKHSGFLQFEDEGSESRIEGSIDFTGSTVVVRVGDSVVAEVQPSGLVASALDEGRHRLVIGDEGLIFEPDDPEAFGKELTAHAFSIRLSPAQPSAPLPATSPPVLAVSPTSMPSPINPPKSPGVAAVLSFLWPGLGQIYNGQGMKAVLFIVAQIINFLLAFVVIGFLTGFVVWIWAMVDAYKGSEAYNQHMAQYPGR